LEQFLFIIKLLERLCFSVGHDFYEALGNLHYSFLNLAKFYREMLKLYIVYSQLISHEIETNGKQVANHFTIKKYKIIKQSILKVVQIFIEKSQDIDLVAQNFIPPLIEVLEDYTLAQQEGRYSYQNFFISK
jgi:hypothetical protein